MSLTRVYYILVLVLFLTACAPQGKKLLGATTAEIPSTQTPDETPINLPGDKTLDLCSKLDLVDVRWPSDLQEVQWTYYALALNITGSFEGNFGWKTISNNFDGQGLSLGLMQQNLGQGTLQPLLVEMYRQYNSTLISNFSNADYKSMKSMVESWLNQGTITPAARDLASEELFPDRNNNKLDFDYVSPDVRELANGPTSQSVQWAKNNIYSGSSFIARWKKSLQDMAVSAGYRTLQLSANNKIFLKAVAYFQAFRFSELRSLLMLFDVVVQNGSINASQADTFNKWDKANPKASETARALKLIEIRVASVNPRYQEDVRSRKVSIINGNGVVHGSARDYAKEFCFNPRVTVTQSP